MWCVVQTVEVRRVVVSAAPAVPQWRHARGGAEPTHSLQGVGEFFTDLFEHFVNFRADQCKRDHRLTLLFAHQDTSPERECEALDVVQHIYDSPPLATSCLVIPSPGLLIGVSRHRWRSSVLAHGYGRALCFKRIVSSSGPSGPETKF